MSTAARLLPIEDDGRVVLPADLREKLGLKRGDLAAAVETPDGLLLTARRAAIERDLARVDEDLKERSTALTSLHPTT